MNKNPNLQSRVSGAGFRAGLTQTGFTLVEMIIVIVITGIIGGIVATFLLSPVQGYMDSARRGELTDIADTALRRVTRDLRLALPNSMRVTQVGATTYLEYLPVKGGGRYRAAAAPVGASAGCGSLAADVLDFGAADTCFEVLGSMPVFAAGDLVVVYNRGPGTGVDAYAADNTATYSANTATTVTISPGKQFPYPSPGRRFQVIDKPVTYVCAPATDAAGNGTGTLTRYGGYAIQAAQPVDAAAAPLATATQGVLAGKVSACNIGYNAAVGARLGLVTLQLTITDGGESVTLYSSAHVSNVP